jgi:hypothetical protein
MNKFVVAAATAALLATTALATAQTQDAQGTSAAEEIIKKKPNANSATEAAPGQMQKTGEADSATEVAPGQQQKTGEADAQDVAPGQQQQQTGEAEGQPSTETTASIDINTEQRTEITRVFREVKAEPVNIDFEVNVGVTVPRTVTLRPLPPRVIEIVPAYSNYEYFVLADGRIVIVEPSTFRVVYVLVV